MDSLSEFSIEIEGSEIIKLLKQIYFNLTILHSILANKPIYIYFILYILLIVALNILLTLIPQKGQ